MKIFPGSSTSSDSIPAPHRMAYHRLEVLRLASAHVAQVDLMVIPPTFKIRLVSLLPRIKFHTPDCLRLVVIGTDVHALDAQTFFIGQEFHL